MEQRFFTVSETANYLCIPRTKVYELVKSKDFPSIRYGKTWRVDSSKLEKWIDEQIELSTPGLLCTTLKRIK